MPPPIPIPVDVRRWLNAVFAGCNERAATAMTQVPTIHEVPLDMTFIQHFVGVSVPRRFPSGWVVEISTHYLGGGRHYGEWGDWPRRWDDQDTSGPCEVGCRIVPARQLHSALTGQPDGHSPAYGELRASLGTPFDPDLHPTGWRLEHFVTNLLLDCETGYIADSRSDRGLNYIFNRRSGPIAAALAITLDAPA